MRFMMLCYDDQQHWDNVGEAAHRAAMEDAIKLTHELKSKGQYVVAAPLQRTTTAKSVRVRDGKRLVTDGPFVETREHLGGFYIIEADNIDEVVEIAARHPGVFTGGVEVRPIIELEGLPEEGWGKK